MWRTFCVRPGAATALRTLIVERRRFVRYLSRAPVVFVSGRICAGGFTQNISAAGIYVLCRGPQCLAVGADISVEVMLPPIAGGRSLRLKGTGRVLRREVVPEQTGFAAEINFENERDLE
jgi:hypothetical protein